MELTKKVENRFRIDLKNLSKYTDREILKNVHYTEDGHVEMTNSFVAVRLSDVYDGEGKLLHGNPEGKYPSLDNIIGHLEDKKEVNGVFVKEIENVLESFKTLKPETVILNFTNNGVIFQVVVPDHLQDKSIASIKMELDIKESFQVAFDFNYLLIGMKFMRLLGIKEVDMYFKKSVRPVSFVYENLEVLIAPKRVPVHDLKTVRELEEETKWI